MLKALDVGAAYQPSKRSESWIKIKRCTDLAPGSAFCLAQMHTRISSMTAGPRARGVHAWPQGLQSAQQQCLAYVQPLDCTDCCTATTIWLQS